MGYKSLLLTQNRFALVDEGDFELFSKFKWCVTGRGYVVRSKTINGKERQLLLHREIMKAQKEQQVDHINGDRFDNRKSNLRIVTEHQNHMNRRKSKNREGYKGVYLDQRRQKWYTQIMLNNKTISLGVFDDPKEAAVAYDNAARKYFGEYASPNFERSVV